MNQLRDYQTACVEATLHEFAEHASALVVLPTGGGKTIVFAEIIKRMQPARAMVLAHRKELIWQAHDKIEQWTGLEADVEMADLRANEFGLLSRSPVIVSSVQTQISEMKNGHRRMSRFRPDDFSLLIVDESHHGTADSYTDIIAYYKQNPKLKVLGVTATPDRGDEEALGQVFEVVAYNYEILDAIQDGWLVDVSQRYVRIKHLDYSAVRTTAGDLNGADLASVLEVEEIIQKMAQPSLEAMYRLPNEWLSQFDPKEWRQRLIECGKAPRRTIVFTVSKRQAEYMAEVFSRSCPKQADWVCDATPPETRDKLLGKNGSFRMGETYIVANVGVLSEGFDNPEVELIVMARPTKSRALYAQHIGRGTRPLAKAEGGTIVDGLTTPDERKGAIKASRKPYVAVLDFVGNSGRHSLVGTPDLLGGNVSDRAIERARKLALDGQPVMMSKLLAKSEKQIQSEDERQRLERIAQEQAQRRDIRAKVVYQTEVRDPFAELGIQRVRARGWDIGKRLTDKQRAVLRKQGYDPDKLTYAEGRQVIGELFRRWNDPTPTPGQMKVLKRYHLEEKVKTRKEASRAIDQIAKAHWPPPETWNLNAQPPLTGGQQ